MDGDQSKDAADETVLANNSFVPLIPRLNRIDQLLKVLLEEKHSLSRRDFHACNNKIDQVAMENNEEECQIKKISMSSALEEIQHKGSLVDRLASLENRLLELSMDMDVGNTSKSSSSTTVQLASETTGKVFELQSNLRVKEDENQMSNNSSDNGHETWEKKGHVGKTTSTRNKVKIRKKWLRLFKIRLTC